MRSFLKCFSFVLIIMIFFSFSRVKADGSRLTLIRSEEVTETIDYAKGRDGKSYKKGYCLGFVTSCWKHTYGNDWPTEGKCCAYKSWNSYEKHKTLDDIPEGATVYFKDVYGKVTYCGNHAAGHAGIYIGKNKNGEEEIVHAWNGKSIKTTINYVENAGYKCLGWGYPGGIEIENEPPSIENSQLKINLTSYPERLTQGTSYGLRGDITSNYKIVEVKGEILRKLSDNKYEPTSVIVTFEPNIRSIEIESSNLNKKIKFAGLNVGEYQLKITAKDISGKTLQISKNFKVIALNINLTKIPAKIIEGNSFGLRGEISSNSKIHKVRGYIKDSNGNVICSSVDSPNAKTMDIRYANLNKKLIFKQLKEGSYTLEIKAISEKGKVETVKYPFLVKKSK